MTKHKHMPPVPPANRSRKGTGSNPNTQIDKEPPERPDNIDEVGDRANIKQNTSNVQDKR